ncbi:MAG TPA: hypothetical protein VMB71_10315 [Acetobacteraceae bacterium]|nr:hypothetical protein [Acetobacteraceae bacterium]
MMKAIRLVLISGLALAAAGCACRPGRVGPYGVHPARCWVW